MNSLKVNAIQWMDSLKGLAISGIVLYHFFNLLSTGVVHKLAKIGSQGIHIFFILSGFGLTFSCLRLDRIRWREWFYRRFRNVLVPYYGAVAFVILTTFAFLPVKLHSLLASVLLYRNFFLGEVLAINSAWWFIPTILEFYIIFPLLFYMRQSRFFLLGTFGLNALFAVAYAWLAKDYIPLYSRFFLSFIFEFALGMVMAEIYLHDPGAFRRRFTGRLWIAGGAASLAIGLLLSFSREIVISELNNMFNAVGTFILSYNLVDAFASKGILNFLGRNSLAIFLLHETYIQLLYKRFGNHLSSAMLLLLLTGYLIGLIPVSRSFQKFFRHAKAL